MNATRSLLRILSSNVQALHSSVLRMFIHHIISFDHHHHQPFKVVSGTIIVGFRY
ncbi:hypothetical protein PGT21_019887 [Puccinia graminis f. sp. tritici]|uniref:Uncharacterized protein n=1 Tax=Puccinia graminis f. sp. tritici TaxID=56615 RepID=A0A5B0LXX6_PUCGR|nr:hypothetical protein PGT21_019887 [Puccinia graminis f. sp. tritici]